MEYNKKEIRIPETKKDLLEHDELSLPVNYKPTASESQSMLFQSPQEP